MNKLKAQLLFLFALWLVVINFASTPTASGVELKPAKEDFYNWYPERDRTLIIVMKNGIKYRYNIKEFKESESCKPLKTWRDEITLLTHMGPMAYEYLIKDQPMAYQMPNSSEWIWTKKRTYIPKEGE